MDYNNIYQQWQKQVEDKEMKAQLAILLPDEVEEAFMKRLEFGTGGIRAIMGAGSSRLNIYTIQKIAKGTANYLLEKNKENVSVVIGYDNRNNSLKFARLTATVLASEGIEVILAKGCNPTPYLSFMVRYLKVSAGIMITASHNPKEYNGYKLYGSDGCQLTDDESLLVSNHIDKVDPFKIQTKTFSEYFLKEGKIKVMSCHNAYVKAVRDSVENRLTTQLNRQPPSAKEVLNLPNVFDHLKLNVAQGPLRGELRVVYSPLCGTGGFLTPKLLKKTARVIKEERQLRADGNFTTCPIPNPENPKAYTLSLECAKNNRADIIIATDPDADRMGVMALDAVDKEYKFISGNQIGVLLSYFLLASNQSLKGTDRYISNPLIVRTVVTTPMVDRIAEFFNAQTKVVLTGFKYIGETIKKLEESNSQHRFLLGFEDSHGFLSGDYVRDKDGLQASLFITELAKALKQQGRTLIDLLDVLYKKFGYYQHRTLSVRFDTPDGKERIKSLMDKVRKESIDDLKVTSIKDYSEGIDGLYKTDMIQLVTESGSVIIRPSGTEPLLKIYLTAYSINKQGCEALLENTAHIVQRFLS